MVRLHLIDLGSVFARHEKARLPGVASGPRSNALGGGPFGGKGSDSHGADEDDRADRNRRQQREDVRRHRAHGYFLVFIMLAGGRLGGRRGQPATRLEGGNNLTPHFMKVRKYAGVCSFLHQRVVRSAQEGAFDYNRISRPIVFSSVSVEPSLAVGKGAILEPRSRSALTRSASSSLSKGLLM